jgi:butyrate kinase
MIYQIARYIAAAAVPVCGRVDHIILTGGIAYSAYLTDRLRQYVSFIAPVTVVRARTNSRRWLKAPSAS